jgi:hypothetical protein
MSVRASFTATWLKPQHKHRKTTTAAALNSSGRVAAVCGACVVEVIDGFPAGKSAFSS